MLGHQPNVCVQFTLQYLSASKVMDIRCSVVSVIFSDFASGEDYFSVYSMPVAKSNDRTTSEELGQCSCQLTVCYVSSLYRIVAPPSRVTRLFLFLRFTYQLLITLLQRISL